jgi:hypothetical protein
MAIKIRHPKTLTDRELQEQIYDMLIILYSRIEMIEEVVNERYKYEELKEIIGDSTLNDTIYDIENQVKILHEEYEIFGLDKDVIK